MICSRCGKEIPEGAPYCCWCGTRCVGKICAVCGAGLRSDQLFCHVCGMRCDSNKTQNAERPQVKVPDPPEGQKMQKLHIIRRWQTVCSDIRFRVYVNSKELGCISSGGSLSTDIVVGEEVIIEIVGYSSGWVFMFSKGITLTDMDNPQVYLRISEGLNYWEENELSPKIEITATGAKIWKRYEKYE